MAGGEEQQQEKMMISQLSDANK